MSESGWSPAVHWSAHCTACNHDWTGMARSTAYAGSILVQTGQCPLCRRIGNALIWAYISDGSTAEHIDPAGLRERAEFSGLRESDQLRALRERAERAEARAKTAERERHHWAMQCCKAHDRASYFEREMHRHLVRLASMGFTLNSDDYQDASALMRKALAIALDAAEELLAREGKD